MDGRRCGFLWDDGGEEGGVGGGGGVDGYGADGGSEVKVWSRTSIEVGRDAMSTHTGAFAALATKSTLQGGLQSAALATKSALQGPQCFLAPATKSAPLKYFACHKTCAQGPQSPEPATKCALQVHKVYYTLAMKPAVQDSFACREICTSRSTNTCACCEIFWCTTHCVCLEVCTSHQSRLPRNLDFKVHEALCLQRNLHLKIHIARPSQGDSHPKPKRSFRSRLPKS